MHIITRKRLNEFGETYPDAVEPLAVWYRTMKAAKYADPHEVREAFASADFLKSGKTVFNIGGNKYRLVVVMRYKAGRHGRVYIRHVLTHAEYEKLSKKGQL